MAAGFSFILSNNSGLLSYSASESETSLLSNNGAENNTNILTATNSDYGFDAFGGKDIFGSIDFSNMNENLFADASQAETAGSIAFNSIETVGSIACTSVETAGSVACSSTGFDSGSCGGDAFSSVC